MIGTGQLILKTSVNTVSFSSFFVNLFDETCIVGHHTYPYSNVEYDDGMTWENDIMSFCGNKLTN